MHEFAQFIVNAFAPLRDLASILAVQIERTACSTTPLGRFGVAALIVASVMIAIGCSAWAIIERSVCSTQRAYMQSALRRAQRAVHFRNALLESVPESTVVFKGADKSMMSFRKGGDVFQCCLAGPDAAIFATATDALLARGTAFALTVRTIGMRAVAVRGLPLGDSAAVFFQIGESKTVRRGEEHDRPTAEPAHRIAAISSDHNASGFEAIAKPEQDERSSDAVIGHERARVWARARDLSSQIDRSFEILDKLDTAIAVFGPDRRLVHFNQALLRLWSLQNLQDRTTADEFLDLLRVERHLPEWNDYADHKRDLLALFQEQDGDWEEVWHLSGGKSVRVTVKSRPLGGLIFIFEDISERLGWETVNNTLRHVHAATLNTLAEGAIVIGPDGRLKQHNAVFARQWRLNDGDLSGEPHVSELASHCAVTVGRDAIWDIVTSASTSMEPERLGEWGALTRGDGRETSLRISRLPDGSTLVVFAESEPQIRQRSSLAGLDAIAA